MYYFPTVDVKGQRPRRVTLEFNSSEYPYSETRRHIGLDLSPIPGAFGHPLILPMDAQVVTKSYSTTGLGNSVTFLVKAPIQLKTTTMARQNVTINKGNPLVMRMGHMQSIESVVRDGEMLSAGTQIGKIGSTGRSTGAHVHIDFQINSGTYVDPLPILLQLLAENDKKEEGNTRVRIFDPISNRQIGIGTLVAGTDKVYPISFDFK